MAESEPAPDVAADAESDRTQADPLPWTALGALGVGLFGMGAAIGSYSGYVPVLLARGVSPDMAGLGMTLFLLGLVLAVLPADWATRYLSLRGVTVAGLAVGGTGALLAGVPSLPAALLSRALIGVGQGAVFVTSMKYVGLRTHPSATARAQGILGGVFTLGFAFALAATPLLLSVVGTWVPSATAAAVFLGGVWTARLPHARTQRRPSLREYAAAFADTRGLALGLANTATFGFLIVATTWYTDLMGRFPTLPVTGVLAGFALMTVVGRVAGGWLETRFGTWTTVSTSLLGLTGALCVLLAALYAQSPALLVVGVVGTGLGFGIPFGPLFSFAFSELTAEPGTVLVEMMVLGNGGALVYPWLIGQLLSETASYLAGFLVMTLTVFAVWCLWVTVVPRSS